MLKLTLTLEHNVADLRKLNFEHNKLHLMISPIVGGTLNSYANDGTILMIQPLYIFRSRFSYNYSCNQYFTLQHRLHSINPVETDHQ